MTVEFNFELVFKGTVEEIRNIINVVESYNRDSAVRLDVVEINNDIKPSVITDEYIEELAALDEIIITASGPYGNYEHLKEVDIFKKIAESAPDAYFEGEIRGGSSYDTQKLTAKLEGKLLKVSITVEDNSAPENAWCEYFAKKINLKKFKSLFKVDGEDLDKESYIDLINIIAFDYDGLSVMQYDDFIDCLESMDLETDIEEDQFCETIDKIFNDLEVEDVGDYSGEYDVDKFEYTYDPITKKEI